jgi:hypothetical protein
MIGVPRHREIGLTNHATSMIDPQSKGTARGDMCFVPYIEHRIIKISATETIHRG